LGNNIRPAWNPPDGSISQFEHLSLFLNEPIGLTVVVFGAAALLLRKVWFTVRVVTPLVAIIALSISTWIEGHDVTNAAISDGCMAMPVLTTSALFAMCAILSAITWHRSRRRRTAISTDAQDHNTDADNQSTRSRSG